MYESVNKVKEETFWLLKAYPHKWGAGAVHIFMDEKTLCGKTFEACPGERDVVGVLADVTCKVCLKVRQNRIDFEAKRLEWEAERLQLEAKRTKEKIEWQLAYEEYLQSSDWKEKRAKVFQRSNYVCEGCGVRRVAEVHHLRYPHEVLPGTPEWIRREKLFDLVGLCGRCHRDIHEERE